MSLSGSIIMLLFSNNLVKRIIKIGSKVKMIARGEWNNPITADKNDELGVLEQTFEDMRVQLILQQGYKNEMFQNISHELITPIMIINTYAQSIKDGIYPETDLEHTLDVIIEESKKLDDKVQKILYLNKIHYLKNNFENFSYIEIEPVIQAIVQRLQNISMVKFELDLKKNVSFYGDTEKWTVAIENILLNGLRYAKKVIKISLDVDTLVIFNDGPPIEFADPNDVFLAYKKGEAGNNGIGLEITKSVIELFNFTISAHNVVDGVSFIIKR
jgi:two-component system sensor histidine kinase CssS